MNAEPKTEREAKILRDAFMRGVDWAFGHTSETLADDKYAGSGSSARRVQAAEALYPTPTETEYNTEEDPEHSSWYWRVKDGELQINFIHEAVNDWEPYSTNSTPGLLPTAKRCAVWLKLFADPSRQVPIP